MATKKAGKGYRSPINLRLPQTPTVEDPQMFSEMLQVYNAIHTLNAYLDQLRLALEGGDPEQEPSESMRFLRGFWAEAAEDIDESNIVSMRNGKVRKGADKSVGFQNFFTGLSLTSAKQGEKVRFGVGPAIVKVPGFTAGQWAWAPVVNEQGAGQISATRPKGVDEDDGDEYFLQATIVGRCLIDEYVVLIPNIVLPENVADNQNEE